jgi:hypothetical protein
MHQYCVFTQNPDFQSVVEWLVARELRLEVHLNRTRFWIPSGTVHTEFMLRWYHCCSRVVDDEDLITGFSSDMSH